MSRRATQPCDIYDAPPYSTRCRTNDFYPNPNSWSNQYYYKPSNFPNPFAYLRRHLPFMNEANACKDLQLYKSKDEESGNCCGCPRCSPEGYVCGATIAPQVCPLKSCLKATKCVSKEDPPAVLEHVCSNPLECCVCRRYCFVVKRTKLIKTVGFFILATMALFAWLINSNVTNTSKYRYRLW